MKEIFKVNALIALGYTIVLIAISFLFNRVGQAIILNLVYMLIAGLHFMAMGVLMAVYHFSNKNDKRNGYMASFAFIWFLLLFVQIGAFYFR